MLFLVPHPWLFPPLLSYAASGGHLLKSQRLVVPSKSTISELLAGATSSLYPWIEGGVELRFGASLQSRDCQFRRNCQFLDCRTAKLMAYG